MDSVNNKMKPPQHRSRRNGGPPYYGPNPWLLIQYDGRNLIRLLTNTSRKQRHTQLLRDTGSGLGDLLRRL
jgi:hypothetical protein